jgi:GDPmannose 4,6-dehydratase
VPRARVLSAGVAGQDGSYLAELLLAEGAEVHGVVRPPAERELPNLTAVRDQLVLHEADLDVEGQIAALVLEIRPEEVFHLAGPAFVPDSWREPARTIRQIVDSGAELLQAIRDHAPSAHVVVASSREIFGSAAPSPQDEQTRCAPSSPYGVGKLAVHQLVSLARKHEGLHASSAILYNHESPRRPANYVSRKVTRAAAAISLGQEDELVLGDLDAVRDWSAASDVVRGLRLMAGAPEADDYVLASGVGRTVRDFVEAAFAVVGLEPSAYLRVDPQFVRPVESTAAIGNPTRAHERLGWSAQTSFEELVAEMVGADLASLATDALT